MSTLGIIHTFKQLKADLSSMSHQERREHIWYHFKWHIVAALVGVIALTSLFLSILSGSKQDILGGGFINVTVSETGLEYLTSEYLQLNDCKESKYEVFIYDSGLVGLTAEELQQNANFTISFITLIGAQELDFLIMDQTSMDYYIQQDLYLDLQNVFSAEDLQQLSPYLVYKSTEEEGVSFTYPVGICIDNFSFTTKCIQAEQPVYLLFTKNSTRTDKLDDFYNYLCSWSNPT